MDYRKVLEGAIPSDKGGEWKIHDTAKFGAFEDWEGATGECRVEELHDGVWTGLMYLPNSEEFGAVIWYQGETITIDGIYSTDELDEGISSALSFGMGFLRGKGIRI
jgi:hypothetical protein